MSFRRPQQRWEHEHLDAEDGRFFRKHGTEILIKGLFYYNCIHCTKPFKTKVLYDWVCPTCKEKTNAKEKVKV